MKLKILSNIPKLPNAIRPDREFIHKIYESDGSAFSRLKAIFSYINNYDYVIFNMMHPDVYLFSILKYILPFSRCKIVVADLILPIPSNRLRDRLIKLIRIIFLKKVYLFINYAKDNSGFESIYKISSNKFRYIPFKVNNIDAIKKLTPTDEGYIFIGGQTRRDFGTFIKAMEGLDYPVRIVTPRSSILSLHGSSLNTDDLPSNYIFVRDATTPDTFTRQIAGARLVVIPIVKNNISPSGIGVYLQCMRLGKCVIISSGPSVDGILNDDQAIIVTPENSKILRDAIIKGYTDEKYRSKIAQNGYNYALRLKDEKRLNADIVDLIFKEHKLATE